ncbi:MAG: hypothetical protein KR126chlam4_00868 [Candidatus Anoxychlamydiales bacterium]|nr:hypothetical protein [Candidatus Anoxychlamydiales bacterium]
MTTPTKRKDSPKPPPSAGASGKPDGSSDNPSVDTTAKRTKEAASQTKLGKYAFSAKHKSNQVSIALEKVKDTHKKRKIGGQKIKEITAKKPSTKEPANLSPTEWKTLTKVTEKAKEIFWPEKHWKKALLSPVGIFAGAGLALAHGAKTITHGAKYLKKNISKDSKLPPFLHNINPFRSQDFVELTEDEQDKFCKKMDKAWEKHQKAYNKGKEDDEKILSEDVVKWGFEIPKKKGGRFGFRIIYRIPDKNGKYVKDSKDKTRKYKVDKNGYFEYKMKYLFWGKLDLDDLDDVFVESTSIVDNWDEIDDRLRCTAPTLAQLKEKIKNLSNSTEKVKAEKTAKQNCWLHTTVQRVLNNKKIIAALKDEKKFNKNHTNKTKDEQSDLLKLKEKTKNLIECIKKCAGKTPSEQYSIIEEKYDDQESYAEKIRKDLRLKGNTQEDSDMAYKDLENYLLKIGAIDVAQIIEEREYSPLADSEDQKKESINSSSINIPVLKKGETINLTNSINEYFCVDRKGSTTKDAPGAERTFKDTITIPKKPSSITIEISDKATLENVPFNLKYENERFVADDKGDFEFNYASIHEGDRGGGHYFSIYRENGEYYIYDNTQDLSDKEALKIDLDTVKKHLKNAKTIVYEDKSAIAAEEVPKNNESKWYSNFSLFGAKKPKTT